MSEERGNFAQELKLDDARMAKAGMPQLARHRVRRRLQVPRKRRRRFARLVLLGAAAVAVLLFYAFSLSRESQPQPLVAGFSIDSKGPNLQLSVEAPKLSYQFSVSDAPQLLVRQGSCRLSLPGTDTQLSVEGPARLAAGASLQLVTGAFTVRASDVSIATPHGIIRATRAQLQVVQGDDSGHVSVARGHVRVRIAGDEFVVRPGETFHWPSLATEH